MQSHPHHDPRTWTAATIDAQTTWYHTLSTDCLAAIADATRAHDPHHRPVTEARLSEEQREVCRGALQPALDALEEGRGFVVLRGLPLGELDARAATLRYWLIGQALGVPFEQNVQGTLLYDVRDTGQDVSYGARFSVTNAESSFHTDNSFGADVLDYVGLLCLNGSKSGGLSQIVSGWTAYRELRAEHPEVIEVLSRPFHFDRRGGLRPGESPTAWFPIVQHHGDELLYRYLRYWIEAGHEKRGDALTLPQRRALDVLDERLNQPRLRVEFSLKPGEMLFVNNRWLLHNRTAFEDHTEPEKKRHYVRLWLRADDPPLAA